MAVILRRWNRKWLNVKGTEHNCSLFLSFRYSLTVFVFPERVWTVFVVFGVYLFHIMAHSNMQSRALCFESNKIKGPPVGGLRSTKKPEKPNGLKLMEPAANLKESASLGSPFELAATPKTRGRMRLNRSNRRTLVNEQFEKRLSIPSFRVADQILMDLLTEKQQNNMDALGEEEEADDEDSENEQDDEPEIIVFDDEEDLNDDDTLRISGNLQIRNSLIGLTQSDAPLTPNILLTPDLDSNSHQNGAVKTYKDIRWRNGRERNLRNGVMTRSEQKTVDESESKENALRASKRSTASSTGSSTGFKINVSRWGRASGSSSSISDSDSSGNDNDHHLTHKSMKRGSGPSGFSGLLRSVSAEFDDKMQSSQSFTDDELQSILHSESIAALESVSAKRSTLSAADSVILVAQELLETELQYEGHLSNLERLLLGPLSTSYMANDGVTSVLRQCVVKMVSVSRSFSRRLSIYVKALQIPQLANWIYFSCKRFGVYSHFAKMYGVFMDRMAMSKKTDRRISIWINRQERRYRTELGNQRMSSLLMMAIQRLPRYILLLDELRKHTLSMEEGVGTLLFLDLAKSEIETVSARGTLCSHFLSQSVC